MPACVTASRPNAAPYKAPDSWQTVSCSISSGESLLHMQDPSLPKGHAIWIATKDMPAGLYYVTDDREDADGWADALHLAVHLMSRQQLTALGSVLQPDTATSRRTTATQ